MNISFIGFGHLAKAIARGLIQQKEHKLSASAPSLPIGINPDQIKTHHDNKQILSNADIIILAVKPRLMAEVLNEIAPYVPDHCVLISVAAGLRLDWCARYCKPRQAIIRTIPNTPAAIGLAATPMLANAYTTMAQKKETERLFSSIGITTWATHEEEMDTWTALSASGPAYVFLFIESLVHAAVENGLEASIAKTFTLHMIKGAVELVKNSDLSLSQLRSNIATPGGTTAAALHVLNPDLEHLIHNALHAAKQRSYELGQSI